MLIDIVAKQVSYAQISVFVINDRIDTGLLCKLEKYCKVVLCKRQPGSHNPMDIIRINYYLYKFKPDIIHFHYTGLINLLITPIPKVITIHNVHSSPEEFGRYNAIYAISQAVKDNIASYGYKSILVENGGDLSSILKSDRQHAGSLYRILQVGRLFHHHKGQHILIEALNILVHDKEFQNIQVDFIGTGESLEYLSSLVCKYNLQAFVNFLGGKPREYIYNHLRDYDLSIQPSISEGFGLAVAESMAACIPVVVSDIPGTMEVIDNGKYGYYFKSEDPHSLADSIVNVYAQRPDPQFLNDAREYAVTHYDVSITAQSYLDEYKKVISHSI